jgi:hypothetical protein
MNSVHCEPWTNTRNSENAMCQSVLERAACVCMFFFAEEEKLRCASGKNGMRFCWSVNEYNRRCIGRKPISDYLSLRDHAIGCIRCNERDMLKLSEKISDLIPWYCKKYWLAQWNDRSVADGII